MAETSQAARPRGGRVRAQRADLLDLLHHATSPESSERITHRLAMELSARDAPARYVPTPSGVRTRLSELCAIGFVMVADDKGRTAAGNACHRYRITDDGEVAYRSANPVTGPTLAAVIDDCWVAYQAGLVAPARLAADVQPALYGRRIAVRLVTPEGSYHAGWLDGLSDSDVDRVAALINREPS